MPNKEIEIEGIDSTTGKLILSDGGRTEVDSKWFFRKVTWEIWKIQDSKVKSFRIVGKTAYNPFKKPIPTTYETEVELTVKKGEPANEWEYSIHWIDKDGNVSISDPTISIKPSDFFFQEFAILVVTAVVALLGIFLFWRWKNKSK